jgi:PAS domain S-box-containing protein
VNNEEERLRKLAETNLLDTPREQAFDDIVKLCSQICEAPVALISLLDEKRQWFKACVGLDGIQETPREIAICDHTVRLRETLIVDDVTKDDRFRRNPLVTGAPHIRFYAGAPLITTDGYCIGTLCIVDFKTRSLSVSQREGLETLSRLLMVTIEKRTLAAEAQLDQLQTKNAVQRLNDVTALIDAGVLSVDPSGRCTFVNEAWCRMTGLTREKSLGYGFLSHIIEEDRIHYFPELIKARESKVFYKATVRMRLPDGSIRAIEFHSRPDRSGGRVGTAYDVTESAERINALEKELIELRAIMLTKME